MNRKAWTEMLMKLPIVPGRLQKFHVPDGGGPPVATLDANGLPVEEEVPNILKAVFELTKDLVCLLYNKHPDSEEYESKASKLHQLLVCGPLKEFGRKYFRHTGIHWHLAHQPAVMRAYGRSPLGEGYEHAHQVDIKASYTKCRTVAGLFVTDMLKLGNTRRNLAQLHGYVQCVQPHSKRHADIYQ